MYGDGQNVRDWIHVEDHCRGLLAALEQGRKGEVYNFGASSERRNIEIVRQVLAREAPARADDHRIEIR